MADGSHQTIGLDAPSEQATAKREWVAERIGWTGIAIAVVVALLGWTGPGPLSARRLPSSDGAVVVEYYAVQRYSAPSELIIHFQAPVESKEVRLRVSRSFADRMTPEAIVPTPVSMEMQPDQVVYTFRAGEPGAPGRIVFRYKCETFGWLTYDVEVEPAAPVVVRQLVMP